MQERYVVVDSTFLQFLASEERRGALVALCESKGLRIYPSFVNIAEALAHTSLNARTRLVRGIEHWQGSGGLLPAPRDLLLHSGRAIATGSLTFRMPQTTSANVELDEARLNEDHVSASSFASRLEEGWSASFSGVRGEAQEYLKREKLKGSWPNLEEFLRRAWHESSNLVQTAEWLWGSIGDGAPIEGSTLLRSNIWCLAVDIFGVGMYHRVVREEQVRNPPGALDLLQLLYLTRDVETANFVTDDRALSEAARVLFAIHMPGVKVLSAAEFFAQ